MSSHSIDSFHTKNQLTVQNKTYDYYSLPKLAKTFPDIDRLPCSLKILLENVLRHEDGHEVTQKTISNIAAWLDKSSSTHAIAYHPGRVLMQDFTGVPVFVDLAAMRDALVQLGGDAKHINPTCPVDTVIDHSVQVDQFANTRALIVNTQKETERNLERYECLAWAQQAFSGCRVVPPGRGICHQINLEYLATVVSQSSHDKETLLYPDTAVGTDSHTTMINALSVLAWGVGGIEAEAAMLGEGISLIIPEVMGVKLEGNLRAGVTATDLVLTITQLLRQKGVVGKFVEFYGPGLRHLSLADRATISNMSPEYGATCGYFPTDQETLNYLRLSGRSEEQIALVEAYAKAQGLWHDETREPQFTDTLSLDLKTVEASLAGPKRPQDKVSLQGLPKRFAEYLATTPHAKQAETTFPVPQEQYTMKHGHVVIAAITSCTNTSNPSVLLAAGLLAKKSRQYGLQRKPWVKSSFAPGSKVVTDYLQATDLQQHFDALGFNIVGYGCTTCIGNSGPLPEPVAQCIDEHDITAAAVLSGNRNFEGRIHPQVKTNWLASPPLVVAYALAGTVNIDLHQQALGHDATGQAIFLKDIWPSPEEIATEMAKITSDMFHKEYQGIFEGEADWQAIKVTRSNNYAWRSDSTYIQQPPFFDGLSAELTPLKPFQNLRVLALLGDSITTDHIAPAGSIAKDSPAGLYLQKLGVAVKDFNSYGSRRGNHEVLMRATLANIRIRNAMVPEKRRRLHPTFSKQRYTPYL